MLDSEWCLEDLDCGKNGKCNLTIDRKDAALLFAQR